MAYGYLDNADEAIRAAIEAKKKRDQEDQQNQAKISQVLSGAALGYATGGLAPALAGGAVSLAPSAATILPALQGAKSAYEAKDAGSAALAGLEQGFKPTGQKLETEAMRKAGFTGAEVKGDYGTYKATAPKTMSAYQYAEIAKQGTISKAPTGKQGEIEITNPYTGISEFYNARPPKASSAGSTPFEQKVLNYAVKAAGGSSEWVYKTPEDQQKYLENARAALKGNPVTLTSSTGEAIVDTKNGPSVAGVVPPKVVSPKGKTVKFSDGVNSWEIPNDPSTIERFKQKHPNAK